MKRTKLSRRRFLQVAGAALAAPLVLPSRILGTRAPSRTLAIGVIGCGRQGTGDFKQVIEVGLGAEVPARVVAVCDLDESRALAARAVIGDIYSKKVGAGDHRPAIFRDYRELLAKDGLDAVVISTPDHWHALNAIAAAEAKKGIYLQKPLTYSHREGQLLVAAVRKHGVSLQVGSQQRSDARFRDACQRVRAGLLGKLQRIHVFLPPDKGQGDPKVSPAPSGFDYDTWLGPTAAVPYAEAGVHPISKGTKPDFGRPGWLQIRRYCLGMITGWGSHMNDIAQWGHGGDADSGIVEIEASAEYPSRGLFDVHTKFRAVGRYADGVELIQETGEPAGVRFVGERGSIFVQRGKIEADPPEILKDKIPDSTPMLEVSSHHYRNWLEAVRDRKDPICPVEVGHRSNSLCIITDIAMRTGRKLRWDPKAERFENDSEADGLLDYAHRAPWTL